ncbi:hypothetical protein SUGI_1188070 [Cryptomeria japonica]|nr:hypothetical protein SUGI_1188070 [Cryptomeria japonica]
MEFLKVGSTNKDGGSKKTLTGPKLGVRVCVEEVGYTWHIKRIMREDSLRFAGDSPRFAGDVQMSAIADASSPSSTSYIHLVQHLIEKCLLFNMDQQECSEALSKHANIQPTITVTVWNELEKENKDFFSRYMENKKEFKSEELKQVVDGINARFCKQTL